MEWTDERVQELKDLWNEGLSASKIARMLRGVTRNAVIGKVHRLGLAGRPGPAHINRARPEAPKIIVQPPRSVPVEEEGEGPITLGNGERVTVLTINDRMCRWPIGDPSEKEFHFCGRKPAAGYPYCELHVSKAYQPNPQKRGRK